MEVARSCPQPTLCWVFADRAGHIGLQACGSFPKRRAGLNGLLPIPAWDERNHWQGRIPSELLPRSYDPPEGFVATANNNINPPGGPEFITLPVPGYRRDRIVERLAELPQATLADMRQLQYDVVSLQARRMLELFLAHVADGPVRERLAAWDCRYSIDSLDATLFARLYRNVLLEIFGQRRIRTAAASAGGGCSIFRAAPDIRRWCSRSSTGCWRNDDSLWWRGRDKADLIRRAADRLAGETDEPWGTINSFHFVNRFFPAKRVGRALGFRSRRMAMPGCQATPFQGHLLTTAKRETSFAPSYHLVTDLGTDEVWTNLPGGPSESRFSPFYKNDLPRGWQSGEYKRLGSPL